MSNFAPVLQSLFERSYDTIGLLLDALAPGIATITASCSGVTGTLDVTVADVTLSQIIITPASPGAAAGFSQQLQATGVFWAVFVSETSVGLFTLWLFSRGRWKTARV